MLDYDTISVKYALDMRIQQLFKVVNDTYGYKDIIKDGNVNNLCACIDIFSIRQRVMYLVCSYRNSFKHMSRWTWAKCCCEVLLQMSYTIVSPSNKY